jgi:hypothetical protein
MRKRRSPSETLQVENPEVKARVLAVLQALSGEKSVSEICRETGLQMIQYYKLEGQLLKGMVMAAEASLVRGRRRNPLLESKDLEERNLRLRQEVLRTQAMLRLSRKLFKMSGPARKSGPRRGRPPKTAALEKVTSDPVTAPTHKE